MKPLVLARLFQTEAVGAMRGDRGPKTVPIPFWGSASQIYIEESTPNPILNINALILHPCSIPYSNPHKEPVKGTAF